MHRMTLCTVLATLVVLPLAGGVSAEPKPAWPWPYPGGESTQRIEGLGVTLYVPRRLTPASGSSLLVLLHGARAQGSRLATFFRFWPRKNYVVCAPQATGDVWTPADLARVKRIATTLQAKLPIDADKFHVAGFSNGASNLHTIAFDDQLRARSGTWVGGGFTGAAVPPWARTRFGALFMSGAEDFALTRVRAGPARLRDVVRSVELHVEPSIGHTWPTSQIEYHLWWMGVQEGRFTPGDDLNFDWDDDLLAAQQAVGRGESPGILFYLYDSVADRNSKDARTLQHETFMAARTRQLGRRLQVVMMDKRGNTAALAKMGVPALATPAVVVFGKGGVKPRFFSGAIDAAALQAALAAVSQ